MQSRCSSFLGLLALATQRCTLVLIGLLIAAPSFHVRAQCETADPESILQQILGPPYSPRVRPNHNGSPTEVQVQLDIQSLVSVNPKLHYFEVMGYWRTVWVDSRLNYSGMENANCFPHLKLKLEGETSTPLKSPRVWVPDLYFDSAKTEFYGSYYFWLEPSGKILRSILIKHTFECKMEFADLPFDQQPCPIRLLSYQERSEEVTLVEKDGEGITLKTDGSEVTEWTIESCGAKVVQNWYGTGVDAYAWDDMTFTVKLSRSALYHIRTDFVYTILFTFMTYFGFFINRSAAPARVTIAVIPVLTIVNLLNHIDAQLPRIPYSWLSIYLTTSLVFSVSAVVEYGVVWVLLTYESLRQERLTTLRHLADRLAATRDMVKTESEEAETRKDAPLGETSASVPSSLGRRSNVACLRPSQEAVFTAAWKIFDPKLTGSVSADRMRLGLRQFDLYYTLEQIYEIFEKMGVSETEKMPQEKFVDYLVKMPKPAACSHKGFFDRPPSLLLDIITRSAFLPLYLVFVCSMAIWAGSATPADGECNLH